MFYSFNLFCKYANSREEVNQIKLFSTMKNLSGSDTMNTFSLMSRSTKASKKDSTQFPCCEIVGFGMFPTLGVVDIKMEEISRSVAWRMQDIDKINKVLAS